MKLDDIRREYTQAGLDREQLDDHPMVQFERWLEQALGADLNADPTAMSLATVDAQGQPSARIVLLKNVDQRGFVFYTNLESHKANDMAGNAKVCLHFAWTPLERQVVVYGRAEKLSLAESTKYFLSRPRNSQLAAWTSQQSRTIGSRKLRLSTSSAGHATANWPLGPVNRAVPSGRANCWSRHSSKSNISSAKGKYRCRPFGGAIA